MQPLRVTPITFTDDLRGWARSCEALGLRRVVSSDPDCLAFEATAGAVMGASVAYAERLYGEPIARLLADATVPYIYVPAIAADAPAPPLTLLADVVTPAGIHELVLRGPTGYAILAERHFPTPPGH